MEQTYYNDNDVISKEQVQNAVHSGWEYIFGWATVQRDKKGCLTVTTTTGGTEVTISPEDWSKAAHLFLKKRPDFAGELLNDPDAIVCDLLFQYAVFGEQRYC